MKQELIQILESPYQLETPINHLKRTEVQAVINSIQPNQITGKILKECPAVHAVLLKGYFPAQWKVAQITLILTTGKPHELASYRPISLLPIVSKIFEKLLKRLLPIILNNNLIPNHQFGLR
jgi:hypothetical protein